MVSPFSSLSFFISLSVPFLFSLWFLSQSHSYFLNDFSLSVSHLSLLLSFLWFHFILFYFLISVSNFLVQLNFIWLVIWFDILCDSIIFVYQSVIFRTVLLIVMSDIVFSLITIYLSEWSDRTNVGCPEWWEWSCRYINKRRGFYHSRGQCKKKIFHTYCMISEEYCFILLLHFITIYRKWWCHYFE